MAKANHTHSDNRPLVPRANVKIGQPTVHQMIQDPLTLDDAALLALLEEPETFARLSMLERELVIRLGGTWETIRRMDVQAFNEGLALN